MSNVGYMTAESSSPDSRKMSSKKRKSKTKHRDQSPPPSELNSQPCGPPTSSTTSGGAGRTSTSLFNLHGHRRRTKCNFNGCNVREIRLHLHGFNKAPTTKDGEAVAHYKPAAFYPGDVVNGSVAIILDGSDGDGVSDDDDGDSSSADDHHATADHSQHPLLSGEEPSSPAEAGLMLTRFIDATPASSSSLSLEASSPTADIAAAAMTDAAEMKPKIGSTDDNEVFDETLPLSGKGVSPDSILVTLEGYSKTRLAGRIYRLQHVYINDVKTIAVPTDLSRHGHSHFLFDFKLPENIPPSFDGRHARIRYRVKASFRCAATVKLPIEVRHDGQLEPGVHRGPDDDFDRRNMSFCCFSYGTRSVFGKIDRSIFLHHGDVVLINARFHNLRNKPAQPYVKLIQRQSTKVDFVRATTIKKSLFEWQLSTDANHEPIVPFKDRTWNNARCGLPAVIPSFNSNVVKVDYFIEIGLSEPGSIYSNPVVTLAITMTTAASIPSDGVHLYISGRKHRAIPIRTNTGDLLPPSSSANSYLSAISEGRESACDDMSSCHDRASLAAD